MAHNLTLILSNPNKNLTSTPATVHADRPYFSVRGTLPHPDLLPHIFLKSLNFLMFTLIIVAVGLVTLDP